MTAEETERWATCPNIPAAQVGTEAPSDSIQVRRKPGTGGYLGFLLMLGPGGCPAGPEWKALGSNRAAGGAARAWGTGSRVASGRQQAQRRTAWKHGAGRAGTQSALGMAGGAAESLPTLGCRKSPAAGEIHLGRWGAGPYGGGAPGGRKYQL